MTAPPPRRVIARQVLALLAREGQMGLADIARHLDRKPDQVQGAIGGPLFERVYGPPGEVYRVSAAGRALLAERAIP
jgi:hypothetical protein